ncbi:hypothetical protein TNIN_133491 [Trichonephila inaurata madagascariensis]|uniref:Uncharacterized protein n=1 Tax=Trichonephila inaurata madagascariensis TaxID=2747483 RepID=A0A8X6XBX4_9ARAC|nr:hypothetical protein TNIN_133491 [Trichonephila inaurata madagascariensis]
MGTLKSLRMKLSDIQNEYYEAVENYRDLQPHESEILDIENDGVYIQRHNSLLCRHFGRNVDSQRSPGSGTLPNMEPKNTPTLNVNSECFQPNRPFLLLNRLNGRGEFVGHSRDLSTVLLSTALFYCQNSAEATLANIRNSLWIPSVRNVARKKFLEEASPLGRLVLKVRSN